MLALPLTHASCSGTHIQFWRTLAATVHRVSQLHTGIPLLLAGDSNIGFPYFQLSRSRQADAPLLPIVQEILQSHSLVFRNTPDLPTHRCRAALDITHHSLNTFSPRLRHCPLWFQLLFTCASLLFLAFFPPHVVLLSS